MTVPRLLGITLLGSLVGVGWQLAYDPSQQMLLHVLLGLLMAGFVALACCVIVQRGMIAALEQRADSADAQALQIAKGVASLIRAMAVGDDGVRHAVVEGIQESIDEQGVEVSMAAAKTLGLDDLLPRQR